MSGHKHLLFDSNIGEQKMKSFYEGQGSCPFCNYAEQDCIIEQRGQVLLVKNKYPVLQESCQTVLIETPDCSQELSGYSKEHLYNVIRFGMEKWLEMMASGRYKSVIFFKNHGPFSGGTIAHPHMQIIGLKDIDGQQNIREEYFEGILIDRKGSTELNLSIKPKMGFYEFNIILKDLADIDLMADYIQVTTHYLLHHFNKRCNSYNLFFYKLDSRILVKAIPRFVTSPLYIGYALPQITNRLEAIAAEFRNRYFRT